MQAQNAVKPLICLDNTCSIKLSKTDLLTQKIIRTTTDTISIESYELSANINGGSCGYVAVCPGNGLCPNAIDIITRIQNPTKIYITVNFINKNTLKKFTRSYFYRIYK